MKRFVMAVVMVGVMTVVLTSVAQAKSKSKNFIGLWEGVDINDGARRTISISDNDQDRVFEVAALDTFLSLCEGDRGITQGSGTVGKDGILYVKATLVCLTSGLEISVDLTYEPIKKDDILIEKTPFVPFLLPTTLYRVSAP